MFPSYVVHCFLEEEKGEHVEVIYIFDVKKRILGHLLPKREKKGGDFLHEVEVKGCLFHKRMNQKDQNSL